MNKKNSGDNCLTMHRVAVVHMEEGDAMGIFAIRSPEDKLCAGILRYQDGKIVKRSGMLIDKSDIVKTIIALQKVHAIISSTETREPQINLQVEI